MEIRNNMEALKAFLGVSSLQSTQAQPANNLESRAAPSDFSPDQATLSQAGTQVLQASAQDGVRTDRVAAIQQVLAAGTYQVPTSAVAGKVIDSMLAGGISGDN